MNLIKKYKYPVLLGILFLCAMVLRIYRLTQLPDAIELDEACMGYNTWCLAHYGTDRYLNVRPFYFMHIILKAVKALSILICWFC